ncbi:unnamed protein product [Rotaria socialis]|uniref:EF-hand domain-containing protein n=1 Tax=Rotaria socialis TaxID=392032 RepID=A0A820FWI9_9BILA|nr:unnamed protein product [Rotaria socialis]
MNNVVNMEGAIKQDGSAVVAAPNYSDVPVRTTCPQCRKVVMSQVTETIGLVSNSLVTSLIITIGSIFRGTRISLLLYIFANVINGFGGGSLILLSSYFGYITDIFIEKEQHIKAIAVIEATLNLGVVVDKMINILLRVLHLYLTFNLVINGLPILDKKSDIENGTLNSAQRAMLAEYRMQELPAALRISQIIPKFEAPRKFNLTKIAKDLKDFGIHSLKDDKHIEGLPLERNGQINPDFHKEIFLGNHELFESDIQSDEHKRNKKLEEIFNEADLDHDQHLSKDELLNHVLKNVNQHIQEAKDRNSQLFLLIDSNQDGKVTWHEYFVLYVKFHNVNSTSVKESDTFDFIQGPFDNNFQRELVKIRYRWTEADVGGDNELDIDEFLAFRHPEIAGHSYKHIVDDLILQMDRNDDQKLNETEFAFLPSSVLEDGGNTEWVEMDKRWLEEQKREFHEMDDNKDGVLTKDELLKAYDPMNRVHINNQIKKLFEKVDDSPSDNVLTLNEIQKHSDVFTDMRILDTEKALHDEM